MRWMPSFATHPPTARATRSAPFGSRTHSHRVPRPRATSGSPWRKAVSSATAARTQAHLFDVFQVVGLSAALPSFGQSRRVQRTPSTRGGIRGGTGRRSCGRGILLLWSGSGHVSDIRKPHDKKGQPTYAGSKSPPNASSNVNPPAACWGSTVFLPLPKPHSS